MATVNMLVTVRQDAADRYQFELARVNDAQVTVVSSRDETLDVLESSARQLDVFVVDNLLDDDVHDFIRQVRSHYPRLLIVLVDEDADFGMPGQADALSTAPFRDDDLMQQVRRMIADRRMETLRSDSLPAVRSINQTMKKAQGIEGKQAAAAQAMQDQGFDYAAFYALDAPDPVSLKMGAQVGPRTITSIAPNSSSGDDLMGWVAANGMTRVAGPQDRPNHPLVARGRLGAVACVPVNAGDRLYGVLVGCMDRPDSITQDMVMMLELIAAQLAAALKKEGA